MGNSCLEWSMMIRNFHGMAKSCDMRMNMKRENSLMHPQCDLDNDNFHH